MPVSRRQLLLSSLLALPALVLAPRSAQALGGPQPPLDEPAPDFALPTDDGRERLSLADFRGQWLVLYFYPKDGTPGCTLEAQRFQQDLAAYAERNAQIVGVSADDLSSHSRFRENEGLSYPLLADVKGEISKRYGSWLAPFSLRHTYIIDPEGVLRANFTAVRPVIHSKEVLAKLDELQAG